MLAIALLAPPFPPTPKTYLGVYLGGSRIGYAAYSDRAEQKGNAWFRRTDSRTRMRAGLVGTAMEIAMDGTVWTSLDGKPVRILSKISSGGRKSEVDAVFGPKKVLVKVVNGGQTTTKFLPYPDGPVVDDPMTLISRKDGFAPKTFYILDPLTVAFVKNEIRPLMTFAPIAGAERAVIVKDPRADSTIYLGKNDKVVKVVAPMGMEMRPMTEQEALLPIKADGDAPDLANLNRVPLKGKDLGDGRGTIRAEYRVTGAEVANLAGDGQSVTSDGLLVVAPATFGRGTIAEAAKAKPEWLTPGTYVPSNDPAIKKLAKKIVGDSATVASAATLVRDWVGARMSPNAGIGVLRDAREVLATKEGVCRDYAVLTTTLLRAAGVPTRLAGGLVAADGALYYHAWAEVWDGSAWVGVDSTRPNAAFSAGHIRLGSGTLDEAFTFPFWTGAEAEVVAVERKA